MDDFNRNKISGLLLISLSKNYMSSQSIIACILYSLFWMGRLKKGWISCFGVVGVDVWGAFVCLFQL